MDNMFQIAVLRACLAALAVLLAALALAGLRKVGRLLLRNLKPVALAAILPLAALLTDFAGEKNTNMPLRVIQPVASQAFSSCGTVTNAGWLAHGAYEDWFRIPATNWWVRTADGWLDGLTVFAFCEFRPDIRTTNAFPRPFPQKLSLAPMVNWHMLTNRETLATSHESLFWHGVTESNTLVMTWQIISSSNSLSVVRVEIKPTVVAPANDSVNRHSFGVCEYVEHRQYPSAPAVVWNPFGGGSNVVHGIKDCYQCPLDGCDNPLRAEIGAVRYTPKIKVVEPQWVSSKTFDQVLYSNAVHKGEAGGVGMMLYLYAEPMDVSFSQIMIEEVPCTNCEKDGYFKNPYFDVISGHTRIAGAGEWARVDLDNKIGKEDEAGYVDKIPWLTPDGNETTNAVCAWTDGEVVIDNPFGWNSLGTTNGVPPYKVFGHDIRDTIRIDSHGRVGVFKLDNWVERTTNDVVLLYGPRERKTD